MIILTDIAKEKIKKLLTTPGNEHFSLRIGAQGGGCSGLKFTMNLDIPTSEDEVVILGDNHRVVVDPISLGYIDGTTVDYIETLQGAGFSFLNPLAQRTCGCGKSFSA
jgi:iron-sulfur cluster assembly accessory protein